MYNDPLELKTEQVSNTALKGKRLLRVLIIMTYFFIAFGTFGFLYHFYTSSTRQGTYISDKQYAINQFKGVRVDSVENIYIGEGGQGSVQVFNKNGEYIYSIKFDTYGGVYSIDIDEDILYIIIYRSKQFIAVENQEIIINKIFTEEEYDLAIEEYDFSPEMHIVNDKAYEYKHRNKLIIRNILTNDYEVIRINAPIWPLSILEFGLVSFIAGFINVILYKIKDIDINRKKRKYTTGKLWINEYID